MGKSYKTDLVNGQVFGRWTVVETLPTKEGNNHRMVLCRCECGVQKEVRKSSLTSGDSKSCGCLCSEVNSKRMRTHGLSKEPLYSVWIGMHKRCYNTKNKDFKHYGGRGIKVRDPWHNDEGLKQFVLDMGDSYVEGLELDRVDVNGDYCKENCRWATRREQVINRRVMGSSFDANMITFEGKTLCLSQWADETGLSSSLLSDRITTLGWTVEKALTTPVKVRDSVIVINGERFDPKTVFKSYPNVFQTARKFGITGHQYLALIFKNVGQLVIFTQKQWINFELPKKLLDFDISGRAIPRFTEEFLSRGFFNE